MNTRTDDIEEILQICLDRMIKERESLDSVLADYPEYADELRPALESALWLNQTAAAFEPRPGFITASRRRVLQRIPSRPDTLWGSLEMRWQNFLASLTWAGGRVNSLVWAGIAIFAVLVMVVAGRTLQMAELALPGDPLYAVKHFQEQTRLRLALTSPSQGRLHVEFAQQRLFEVEGLISSGNYSLVEATLAAMDHHLEQAVNQVQILASRQDPQALELANLVQGEAAREAAALQLLAASVPEAIRAELNLALEMAGETIGTITDLIDGAGLSPTLVPTLTKTPTPTRSMPTATATRTLLPTKTSVPLQVHPSQAPTQTPTPTTLPSFKPTATPSSTPTPAYKHQPTYTPTPTEKVPTPRPTKTPKPTQTRRPPKP